MGLYLTIEDRVKLALAVAEAGIKELDCGGPKLLPHQGVACRAIRNAYDEAGIDKTITRISCRYFGVARNHREEIDAIIAAERRNLSDHYVTDYCGGRRVARTTGKNSGSRKILSRQIWSHDNGGYGRHIRHA